MVTVFNSESQSHHSPKSRGQWEEGVWMCPTMGGVWLWKKKIKNKETNEAVATNLQQTCKFLQMKGQA